MSDITEIQPGQSIDAVESLARALQETSAESALITLSPGYLVEDFIPFDQAVSRTQSYWREHARLLLSRMNR